MLTETGITRPTSVSWAAAAAETVSSALVFGIVLSFAAAAPTLAAELVALAVVGAASVGFMAKGNSSLQLAADPSMRGRVMSLWAVAFLGRFDRRPQPRVGIHSGDAVYRDGDYFGNSVNLAHRIVNRALAGEVLVTDRVAATLEARPRLRLEPIGEVSLKGFPVPTELFVVCPAEA